MTVEGRRRAVGGARAALAGLVALAVVAGAGACTSGDDPRERRLAALPTTTVDLGDAEGAELPPPLPGTPPDEIRAALESAVAARDTCALASAIDAGIPDTDDRAAVLSAYRALLDAVRRARSFRPAVLAERWDELVDGVAAGVDALQQARGDLDDPAVTATFTADALQQAVRAVQRWAELHCGAT